MLVLLTRELISAVGENLLSSYPYEGCGFLLGKKKEGIFTLKSFYPVENSWPNLEEKKRRFSIDPKEYLSVEKRAAMVEQEIVGIYHSHPDHSALPSPFDADYAWEGYIYLIFSLTKDEITDYRAYVWRQSEGFQEVQIRLNP